MSAPRSRPVRVQRYVWCDEHGGIHDRTPDPYDYGHADCDPVNWRTVYVASTDPNEEF